MLRSTYSPVFDQAVGLEYSTPRLRSATEPSFDPLHELAMDAARAWLEGEEGLSGVGAREWKGRRILTTCSYCRRIRNAQETWAYIPEHLRPGSCVLSHGICPSCHERNFPTLFYQALANL